MPSGVGHVSPVASAAIVEPAGSVNGMVPKSGIWVMAHSIAQGDHSTVTGYIYYRMQRTECHAPLIGFWRSHREGADFLTQTGSPLPGRLHSQSGPNLRFPVRLSLGNMTTATTAMPMNAVSRKIATTSPRRRVRHLAMSMSTKPIGIPLRDGTAPNLSHVGDRGWSSP